MVEDSIITAGIDTAKHKLDTAVCGKPGSATVENNASGWAKLAAQFTADGVTRVGIEATGGYERGVTRYLQKAGFEVVVLQPLQVRAFAKMRLQRAKNDSIDARLIADCTHMLDAHAKMPPDARFDALADHLTFIEQIEDDIVRIKTRLEHIRDARLRRMDEADIRRLEKRGAGELRRLTAAVRKYDDLAKRFELVCSIPGIGERTALGLVVRMPELGQVSREEAAALAGLAPFVHQSGKYEGQTHIGGGRGRLRVTLYRAALSAASRWNTDLVETYKRLRARGKCHKSALVACTRKLLIFANIVVARVSPWQDRTVHA